MVPIDAMVGTRAGVTTSFVTYKMANRMVPPRAPLSIGWANYSFGREVAGKNPRALQFFSF